MLQSYGLAMNGKSNVMADSCRQLRTAAVKVQVGKLDCR
jgi:hypothetical protein